MDISYPDPVECAFCEGDGKIDTTPCCGSPFVEAAQGYECFRCRTPYSSRKCPECDGDGVVEK